MKMQDQDWVLKNKTVEKYVRQKYAKYYRMVNIDKLAYILSKAKNMKRYLTPHISLMSKCKIALAGSVCGFLIQCMESTYYTNSEHKYRPDYTTVKTNRPTLYNLIMPQKMVSTNHKNFLWLMLSQC